ncbi:hypothetical protein TcWFU_004395 [Taenia crassiceps]|uniref:Uncharacterized protein n=1 Tax=Taenia crassiceps TaxID=6207 RepID=A0ABR4Q855_9CEST
MDSWSRSFNGSLTQLLPSGLAQPCMRNESNYIRTIPDADSNRTGDNRTPSSHPRQHGEPAHGAPVKR